ncbi:MAG TPA: type II toxin-antitoxin system VapC family toxin [Caldilineae bacterium]|nr:type II toxin-antitoxin system VapC family toxin [Caldilineae bacterium]
MTTIFTVDASVFLNAFNPFEADHEESRAFLLRLQQLDRPIIVPTLLFPEVAAGAARARNDTQIAIRYAQELSNLPNIMAVALDRSLSMQTMQIAAQYRLRGSDAVYVAVAQRFGTVLVTRDKQQLERSAPAVSTRRPSDLLE